MKVHEIAKELGVKSKEVIAVFEGHERINHHHDSLSEDEELIVRSNFVKDCVEEVTVAPLDVIEEVVKPQKESLPKGVSAENVWLSCISGGTKSKYWSIRDLGKRPERK